MLEHSKSIKLKLMEAKHACELSSSKINGSCKLSFLTLSWATIKELSHGVDSIVELTMTMGTFLWPINSRCSSR